MAKTEHPVKIRTPLDFLINALKGVFMGIADVVPGVSGGTIALVMGIYDQLIVTVTRVDTQLLKMLRRLQFAKAAKHLNLGFILSLGPGILAGIFCMSAVAATLLEDPVSSQFTFATFFGMISISAYLVIEMIEAKSAAAKLAILLLILSGLIAALLINQLQAQDQQTVDSSPSEIYIFLCAAIAICAMILPGISGSMILMILGVYHHIVKLPKGLFDESQRSDALIGLAVFACGAFLGLMVFSRILKWLLTHFRNSLLAVLTGVMLGALPVLYAEAFRLQPLEDTSTTSLIALIATVIVAALVMFGITRKAAALTQATGQSGNS